MKLKITVQGVAYEVEVEVLDAGEGFAPSMPAPVPTATSSVPSNPSAPPPSPITHAGPAAAGAIASPIAGVVKAIQCAVGTPVKEGEVLVILEAMKMDTSIAAPSPGTVKAIAVAVGDTVRNGQTLIELA